MKKISLLFAMALIFGAAFLNSCDNSTDPVPDAPSVTAPSATAEVMALASVDVSFSVNVPGGFSSASVAAVGGSAAVTSSPSVSATTGTVVVSFTAGSAGGAASVTLTVQDENSKSDDATAVLSVVEEQTIFNVSSNISANTTWETGKVYILQSRVSVLSGVTLTIEPGVVVKGQAGTEANATALIITRGATILAEGTADSPIIFTSVADELMPGEIESPNLEPTLNGLWGGLIVLGKAHISGDAEALQIEGIPASDPNGLYGGTDDADNSGVIKYVSIRHGGANIGEGNEINGLTLGGVGSGTTIENIEIVSNQDDGIEFFGGTVTVKNAVVWNTGDDALDTDQAFAGMVDNALIINPGDECFELDGPEGSYLGSGSTIKNVTANVEDASGLIDLDKNTDINLENIYFTNLLADGSQDVEEYDLYAAQGGFTSSNWEVTLPAGVGLTNIFKGGSDSITTAVEAGANTVGADLSAFSGWSWAAVAGATSF